MRNGVTILSPYSVYKNGLFCSELREEGVLVSPAYSGYYIFPNFEVLRPALKRRGITTGEEMCEALFKEASVAVKSNTKSLK